MRTTVSLFIFILALYACNRDNDSDIMKNIFINSVSVNDVYVSNNGSINNVDFNSMAIRISFSETIDSQALNRDKLYFTGGIGDAFSVRYDKSLKMMTIIPDSKAEPLRKYMMAFDVGKNLGGFFPEGFTCSFTTRLDTLPKFPLISDDSLMTLVQKQTFSYFWDYGHPVSGLARERLGSGDVVTSGGSGFGIMSILVGIERNFITRAQGFERLNKIVSFLAAPSTDVFHGAYPHWLNGSSGKVYPFSSKDDGGDLVETAFLMQGLLAAYEYFKNGTDGERAMCETIQTIWRRVEWDWYRNGDQNRLYWHWSPNYGWYMNMPVSGWNEALIVYVLAASSPTHSIPKAVYDNGWARNGAYPMINGKTFYGIRLPLGFDYGGPLFFTHYSFLGLDPRNLSDQYADYWVQNVAHSRINFEYCKANPRGYAGYGEKCWGLTASDIPDGYSASSPTNDLGVIAPTAALSSFPYTPSESMAAMKFFYYVLGDRLWSYYGFRDAFNLSSSWFAGSYIAIDQGPIVCMIENYRTGFLWDLFMNNTDIQAGLDKLEFTY
ncbi:MAG: beta-glucosidase [Bacteroidales bacterium]|jgi:hypothetical protein|nr:beta-glucosidase [Bacteroidales bacterium]